MSRLTNRRDLIQSSAAMLGLATITAVAEEKGTADIDFSDPDESLLSYAKLAGSTEDAYVYSYYYGTLFGVLPSRLPEPLCGFAGLIKSLWSREEDGSFGQQIFDIGYFTEAGTDKALERLENPYTGELTYPQHYLVGPTRYSHKPGARPWAVFGNFVSVATGRGIEVPNPMRPDEWPKASAGEKLIYRFDTTYFGQLSDLQNPDSRKVRSAYTWNAFNSWLPWLHMGQRPGLVYWQSQGRKIADFSECSAGLLQHIQQTLPVYLEDSIPWTEQKNTTLAYMEKHRPSDP